MPKYGSAKPGKFVTKDGKCGSCHSICKPVAKMIGGGYWYYCLKCQKFSFKKKA